MVRRTGFKVWVIQAGLIVSAITTPLPANELVTRFDRWYVVQMQGQRAGWSRIVVVEDPATGRFQTKTVMDFTIRRGAVPIHMMMESRFVETADGRAIEAKSVQKLGAMEMTKAMRFGAQGIEVVSSQGGREHRNTSPLPTGSGAKWLTPGAAQRYMQGQIADGGQEFEFWTIEPDLGVEPVQVRVTVRGQEDVKVFGKVVPAVVLDATVSVLPGVVTREYVDEAGRSVKSTVSIMPGMTIELIQADKELATTKVQPAEILVSTLIKPDKAIAQPRGLRSAVYELSMSAKGSGHRFESIKLPQSGFQWVRQGDPGGGPNRVHVKVDLAKPVEPSEDQPDEAHLAASVMLDHRDQKLQALLNQALGGAGKGAQPSSGDTAVTLHRFVHQYINERDLSVGFATASEVARTRQGDCTEHAVLLAALLRGAGVPSRVVSGLIYVDQFLGRRSVFGYHMWTQAWIKPVNGGGGRWIDFDATLDKPFDAAHIALGTSRLSDDAMVNDMVAMLPMLGGLEVRVLETKAGAVSPSGYR